jgi:hypothetical protein
MARMRPCALLFACALLQAGQGDPPYLIEAGWEPLLSGRDLNGWRSQDGKPHTWVATKAIRWDSATPDKLNALPEPGDRLLNGPSGKTANLVTDRKFGDIELYIEFMVPKGSNSGVYLHGLYEVQVLDSFGKLQVSTSDCGAIYHRWIGNKPVGGSAPGINASYPPGQWQSFQISFRAPRFDASGKKTENARFSRVLHNGQIVQENVEVDGGTRAHMNLAEAPLNPLMLQGDHGPVAYRNIYVRRIKEGSSK